MGRGEEAAQTEVPVFLIWGRETQLIMCTVMMEYVIHL